MATIKRVTTKYKWGCGEMESGSPRKPIYRYLPDVNTVCDLWPSHCISTHHPKRNECSCSRKDIHKNPQSSIIQNSWNLETMWTSVPVECMNVLQDGVAHGDEKLWTTTARATWISLRAVILLGRRRTRSRTYCLLPATEVPGQSQNSSVVMETGLCSL